MTNRPVVLAECAQAANKKRANHKANPTIDSSLKMLSPDHPLPDSPTMRILHTSDWHLGQHFMGKSRQAEHQSLIDWLLVQVDEHAVDAVLIAGDIFDTGSPPSYARELYSQLVVRLHSAGVALLLLGGNHDSVATLGESRAMLACLSTTVVAAVIDAASQVVVLPYTFCKKRNRTLDRKFCYLRQFFAIGNNSIRKKNHASKGGAPKIIEHLSAGITDFATVMRGLRFQGPD